MLVRDILRRDNNNFDLLRLIAASAVIVGHSQIITGDKEAFDLVGYLTGLDYSGSLAVKFFFLLSGLVVTNSLISNPELRRFLTARVARIFPGLLTVLVLTAYVIGPLVSHVPLHDYFADPETFGYVVSNALMAPVYALPGVFSHGNTQSVNGAIWTIPMEVSCYLVLAVVGALRITRSKSLFTVIVLGVCAVILTHPEWMNVLELPSNKEAISPILFFCVGSLLATWKDHVSVNLETAAGLAIATFLFRATPAYQFLYEAAIFAAAIWWTTQPSALSLRLPGDFSYGVYLIGWPTQQIVHLVFPHVGARGNWMISIPLAIAFGALSWYLIEKPAMGLGKKLGGKLRTPSIGGADAPAN